MNLITRPAATVLLFLLALTATTVAQQKRQTPAKPQPRATTAPTPAPTFDTLVPADSYSIYGEIRGVGQLVQSDALNELLESVIKIFWPPKEFRRLVKWLHEHSDEVMTSRLLVATGRVAKDVPEAIIAIEFASAEEAAKFAKPLNEFLPTVIPAKTPDSPTASPNEGTKTTTPPEPEYYLQQAGSLVLLTPRPLILKKLKPAGSKPLSEDVNFRTARNRFSSEPVFVFVDIRMMDRQQEEQRKQYQTQRLEAEKLQKEQIAAGAEAKKADAPAEIAPEEETPGDVPGEATFVVPAVVTAEGEAQDSLSQSLTILGSSLFSGESNWPEGLGLALSIENDSFDLRALFINKPGEKSDVVPFMPMLIPGPPFVPESQNILPADTEFFATMSLDLQQIYATLSRPRPNSTYYTSRGNVRTVHDEVHVSPFAEIEKRLKINLRDDLLPLLGSEIALRLPITGLDVVGLPRGPSPAPVTKENAARPGATSPALLISLRDKEGVRTLMPKLVESLGFKGASSLAQTEKREDTETISFANIFSYAFVGNFLVLSSDPATVRHIVDSYVKRETLAGDGNFRTSTRWQPRPAHGQLYISPALMESYKSWAEQLSTRISEQTRASLTRLSSVAQPITYSLSNEGYGPLHELHLPRNLVLMVVAGISGETNPPPALRNERMAMGVLYTLAIAQEEYKKDKGNGSYGTLEQLIETQVVSKDRVESSGYRFEVTASGDKFEVRAVPNEYGKSGNLSLFIDESRVLRGIDRNGAPATSADPPVN